MAAPGMVKTQAHAMLNDPKVRAACVSTQKPDVYADCISVGCEVFGIKPA